MKNPQQKSERVFALPSLANLLLTGTVMLQASFISHSAMAATEQTGIEGTEQSQAINLDGYIPDQSLWSEKMKVKYEKAKITEELPLALLSVERLNLVAPVYLGTDRITLDRGLGVVKGTAHPGEVGNIAISGHRDSFFRVLKDIKLGDKIEMQTPQGFEDFEVSEITSVDALEVSVLDPTDTTVLTLITCHPFYYQGYAPDRYIVKATPVDADAAMNKSNPVPEITEKTTNGVTY
jgi:LPXTG-site transpeptidase (sortase) family protein